jgi:peptide deformylase
MDSMSASKILTYPHASLRKKAELWQFFIAPQTVSAETHVNSLFTKRELEEYAVRMHDTLLGSTRGAALAAPQIRVSFRIICFNDELAKQDGVEIPRFAVNPEIVSSGSKTQTINEGCLSFPGIRAPVSRPDDVTVSWQDLEGASHRADFSGFWAHCWQHEIDHLDGVLFIDRMDRKTKYRIKGQF